MEEFSSSSPRNRLGPLVLYLHNAQCFFFCNALHTCNCNYLISLLSKINLHVNQQCISFVYYKQNNVSNLPDTQYLFLVWLIAFVPVAIQHMAEFIFLVFSISPLIQVISENQTFMLNPNHCSLVLHLKLSWVCVCNIS